MYYFYIVLLFIYIHHSFEMEKNSRLTGTFHLPRDTYFLFKVGVHNYFYHIFISNYNTSVQFVQNSYEYLFSPRVQYKHKQNHVETLSLVPCKQRLFKLTHARYSLVEKCHVACRQTPQEGLSICASISLLPVPPLYRSVCGQDWTDELLLRPSTKTALLTSSIPMVNQQQQQRTLCQYHCQKECDLISLTEDYNKTD